MTAYLREMIHLMRQPHALFIWPYIGNAYMRLIMPEDCERERVPQDAELELRNACRALRNHMNRR